MVWCCGCDEWTVRGRFPFTTNVGFGFPKISAVYIFPSNLYSDAKKRLGLHALQAWVPRSLSTCGFLAASLRPCSSIFPSYDRCITETMLTEPDESRESS